MDKYAEKRIKMYLSAMEEDIYIFSRAFNRVRSYKSKIDRLDDEKIYEQKKLDLLLKFDERIKNVLRHYERNKHPAGEVTEDKEVD